MSTEAKKSYGLTLALLVLGLLALWLGSRWLLVLVPAAALVWYGAAPMLRGGRN